MKIIIVGAGLSGLSAAFRFAQLGHEAVVLERSHSLTPQGGGMNIRPNASRILKTWGLTADMEGISQLTPHALLRDLRSGNVAMRNIAVDVADDPDWGVLRQDVIKVLFRKASAAGAIITFGANVVNVCDTVDHAVVLLSDGHAIQADIVLAADGIRSNIRKMILTNLDDEIYAKDPIVSQTTLYSVQLGSTELNQRPGTSRLTDQVNLNVWMGQDGFVVTRHNANLGVTGLLFGINSETDQKSLWDEHGDIAYVRDFFDRLGACSELTQALAIAESCDRWKLAELPNLPRWTSKAGRVLLLGDSAHAMHPNAAQGYSTIIEDIAVLEFLISNYNTSSEHETKSDGGEQKAPMSHISRIWEAIRKPRVERIKNYAKWNTMLFSGSIPAPSNDVEKRNVKSLKNIEPDMDARFQSARFLKWVLDYDAVQEARQFLAKYKSRL